MSLKISKNKHPHFGRLLLPDSSSNRIALDIQVCVDREGCKQSICDSIVFSYDQNTSGAIAVCGSPGSGKSTMMRVLARELTNHTDFDPIVRYIDFEDDFGCPQGNSPTQLLSDHFTSFFSKLEFILIEACSSISEDEEKIRPLKERYKEFFTDINQRYGRKDELEVAFGQVYQALYQKITSVDKKLTIFCDNLDFLEASDQIAFIGMLGLITQNNEKIKCVFTARPLTTARIRMAFHDYMSKKLLDDTLIKSIDCATLLKKRFAISDYKYDEIFDEISIEVLKKVSAGNNQDTLTNAKHLFHDYLKNSKHYPKSEYETLKFLISEKGLIMNPMVRLKADDEVPLKWILISLISNGTEINLDFYTKLKEYIDCITGKTNSKKIKRDRVDKIIAEMIISDYFVRRIDFIDQETDGREIVVQPETIIGSICSLTERGLYLFQRTKLLIEFYPRFHQYRSSVQQFINGTSTSNHGYTSENGDLGNIWRKNDEVE